MAKRPDENIANIQPYTIIERPEEIMTVNNRTFKSSWAIDTKTERGTRVTRVYFPGLSLRSTYHFPQGDRYRWHCCRSPERNHPDICAQLVKLKKD